jgi:DNA mismatch repair protein MSH4
VTNPFVFALCLCLCLSASLFALLTKCAFATFVTVNDDHNRPKLTTGGAIAIKQGRHPVIESMMESSTQFIPNDLFLNEMANTHILTAPNSAGKSTQLRQVGTLTVLAHIGCYVPAMWASFRLTDRIFTRMTMNDDMESNASTFATEMKEINLILRDVEESSLVLIDELGRGTSSVEGIGIAWAACEALSQTKAFTVCATHFWQLTDLAVLYPNIRHHVLEVDSSHGQLKYLYRTREMSNRLNDDGKSESDVKQGTAAASHSILSRSVAQTHSQHDYGIRMAQSAGFPDDIVQRALELNHSMRQAQLEHQRTNAQLTTSSQHSLIQALLALKHTTLDREDLKRYLKQLYRDYMNDADE